MQSMRVSLWLVLLIAVFTSVWAQDINISGRWKVNITFLRGDAEHAMVLKQTGAGLSGTYEGTYTTGEIKGTVTDSDVEFSTSLRYEGSNLSYTFSGQLKDGVLSGTLDLGEYWTAQWTAERL
jgi:hypothetical protein